MILATIKSTKGNAKDGEVVLVHPDRQHIALLPENTFSSLLNLLDNWNSHELLLKNIDQEFRNGIWSNIKQISEVSFLAPLPRTWAFFDGSAYLNHVILARKSRGAEIPTNLSTVPLMYQGASDNLGAYNDPINLSDPEYGLDFEAEIGVILSSVHEGVTNSDAASAIKFITLFNDISYRNLIPQEVRTGFGFIQSKPPSTFAPFVLTPDELSSYWNNGRFNLPVRSYLNNSLFGEPNAKEMHFSFPDLIVHAAKTRCLSAGTIIGGGTVSNKEGNVGSSCIVEKRMVETLEKGGSTTPYLKYGDEIKIEAVYGGVNLFGSIEQRVKINN